jgi:hypothetical protein
VWLVPSRVPLLEGQGCALSCPVIFCSLAPRQAVVLRVPLGFENFQYLYVNQARFNINLAMVESNYLSPLEAAIDEMVDFD